MIASIFILSCAHTHIHTYIYTFTYTNTYIHIYIHTYTHICTHNYGPNGRTCPWYMSSLLVTRSIAALPSASDLTVVVVHANIFVSQFIDEKYECVVCVS